MEEEVEEVEAGTSTVEVELGAGRTPAGVGAEAAVRETAVGAGEISGAGAAAGAGAGTSGCSFLCCALWTLARRPAVVTLPPVISRSTPVAESGEGVTGETGR